MHDQDEELRKEQEEKESRESEYELAIEREIDVALGILQREHPNRAFSPISFAEGYWASEKKHTNPDIHGN